MTDRTPLTEAELERGLEQVCEHCSFELVEAVADTLDVELERVLAELARLAVEQDDRYGPNYGID